MKNPSRRNKHIGTSAQQGEPHHIIKDRDLETQATWNEVAQLYAENFMDLAIYNESYDAFCHSLKEGARVLDIACGPGNIARYLLQKRPDLRLLGIDSAPNMIELAKKQVPTARFQLMNARKIGDLKTTFDAVIAGFYLPYEADPESFFRDVGTVLRPGGFFYLSFVEGEPADSGWQQGSGGGRTWFCYHRLSEILSALKKYHFEECATSRVTFERKNGPDEQHTILIARKL